MRSVIGRKEESRPHSGQLIGCRARGAGVDIVNHDRSAGSAVTLPELVAMCSIIGCEEERAIHVREVGGDGAGWTGSMSLTMTVPPEVPSLFQSSKPC